jgi:type I restriction enzyme S subunit
VTDIKGGEINFDTIKYIPQAEHEELIKRCLPEKGDILYSKNGTIGIPKIIDWDWEFSIFVSLALIKPDHDKIQNLFLNYLLCSKYAWKEIKIRAKQGTVTNLHLEEIRKFKIPFPSLPEQNQISSILSTVDDKLDVLHTKKANYETLKKGLMEQLLTGKMRVKP